MTETILVFPVRNPVPLCRVWFETGDPAWPLASKWIALQQSGTDRTTTVAASLKLISVSVDCAIEKDGLASNYPCL
jgi:hypothetical protein